MQYFGVKCHDSRHLLSAKGSVVYTEREGGNGCGKMLVNLCEGYPAVHCTVLSTFLWL